MDIFSKIENIRRRPEPQRKLIHISLTVAIFALIAGVWGFTTINNLKQAFNSSGDEILAPFAELKSDLSATVNQSVDGTVILEGIE